MIDVHILTHPTQDRSQYLEPLLEALLKEPVNVHLVAGVKGNIGAGRAQGYSLGDSEYKAFIDDDDTFIEGIFDTILETMDKYPDIAGCCTQEIDTASNKPATFPFKYYDPIHIFHIHHLLTYRYSAIKNYLPYIADCKLTAEHTLAAMILKDGHKIRHIPKVGYVWHKHKGGASANGIPNYPKSQELYNELFNEAAKHNYESQIEDQDVWHRMSTE